MSSPPREERRDPGADVGTESADERIFAEALSLPPPERAGHVLRAARGDRTLAGRVLDLLAAHATAGSFLETAAVKRVPAHEAAEIREGPGTTLGPYELVRELGEGGFGVVYAARQLEPVRRDVALKIIKLGMDTRQVIARFEAERQALAVLDHPYIARVFDAGATSTGRPYFVMELVDGVDITKYCDARRLPVRERIRLFIGVCEALHHAHQRGLIHRDLKPSNVLVTERAGRAVPKVIDFGIAKATKQRLTERTVFTEHGQFIGTPVYMSPEQAEHGDADVDTRSDIYSLGVVLYELLTGRPPFEAKDLANRGLAEIQTFIREHEAAAPSARLARLGDDAGAIAAARACAPGGLAAELRGDLDWIVMMALEKERDRRYESAAAFGHDLERFLANMPVLASPPSSLYRLRKFVRRHRIAVGAGAMVVLAVVSGLALMLLGFIEARENLRLADSRSEVAVDLFTSMSSDRAVRDDVRDVDALVARFVRAYGADHPAEVGVRRILAERLEDENRIPEALAEYRRALALTERLHGGHSREYTLLLAQIGRFQARHGRTEEALPDLRAALALERAVFDGPTLRLNPTRSALAALLTAKGDADGALELYQASLATVRAQAPDDHAQFLQTAQPLLMLGLTHFDGPARADELGSVWIEFVDAVDRLYPNGDSTRGLVRLQLVGWNEKAEVFPQDVALGYLREAVDAYVGPQRDVAAARAQARGLLAAKLMQRDAPGDAEEALAVSGAALEDLRLGGTRGAALADELEKHAERLEAFGRYGAAIRAELEVAELRRAALGEGAELRRQKDALERLVTALMLDQRLEQGHADFLAGLEALAWLERAMKGERFELYARQRDFLRLRLGNPLPVLNRLGGSSGSLPPREPKHPYSLAMGALAASVNGQSRRAAELLDEASALMQRPEFSNDRQSMEMIQFVRRTLSR